MTPSHSAPQSDAAARALTAIRAVHTALWLFFASSIVGILIAIPLGALQAALCAAAGSGAYANFSEAIAATQPEVVCYQPDSNRHQQLREGYARYLAVAQSLSRATGAAQ